MPSTNSGTGVEELRIQEQAIADAITASRAVLAQLQTDLAAITAQFAALNSGAYYNRTQVDQMLSAYALTTAIQPFPGTAFGQSVVEATNQAALRTLLGLGSSAVRPASDYVPASMLGTLLAPTFPAVGSYVEAVRAYGGEDEGVQPFAATIPALNGAAEIKSISGAGFAETYIFNDRITARGTVLAGTWEYRGGSPGGATGLFQRVS
jgi:hypothetical protein